MKGKYYFGSPCLSVPETKLIETIFRTSSKLGGRWAVAKSGECDVIAVKADDNDPFTFRLKPDGVLFPIYRRGAKVNDGQAIYTPIKADDIVELMLGFEHGRSTKSEKASVGSGKSKSLYRLRRWPPQSLLTKNSSYSRLAAYLARKSLSLEELKALAGEKESLCWGFLIKLESIGLLEVEAAAPEKTTTRNKKQKGFIAFLRQRLGMVS